MNLGVSRQMELKLSFQKDIKDLVEGKREEYIYRIVAFKFSA